MDNQDQNSQQPLNQSGSQSASGLPPFAPPQINPSIPKSTHEQVNQAQPNGWERSVLEKMVMASVKEQRASRRWGIFFKLITFLYVLGFGALVVKVVAGGGGADDKTIGNLSQPHISVVRLKGVIEADGLASAARLNTSLRAAFEDKLTRAVFIYANSPGGSPVQSDIVNNEIKRLRALYPQKPVYVVVEEMCASGCYYIAAAADKIYVNKASIVGSIGVLMDGYGFTGTMEKLGVERRLMTAGKNKAILDPFSPVKPEHKAFAQAMLDEVHQQFIQAVREGRGKRLKETPDTFSGLFWSGAKSVEMGLADGFGTMRSIALEQFKTENFVDYSPQDDPFEKLAKRFGASIGEGAWETIGPKSWQWK